MLKYYFKYVLIYFLIFFIYNNSLEAQVYSENSTSPIKSTLTKNPYTTGILSSIFPGGGYYYLGQTRKGLISSSLIIPLAYNYYKTTETFGATSLKKNAYFSALNISRYMVYDTFQTALDMSGRSTQIVNIPHYSFSELALSMFDKRSYQYEDAPLILGAVPIIVTLSASIMRIAKKGIHPDITANKVVVSIPLIIAQSILFAVGEEAYFRGFVYPSLSKLTGSKWYGNLLQSMYFGFCHTDLSESIGFRQFPHGLGFIFHNTSTINSDREYAPRSSTASNFAGMNDALRFLALSTAGFAWGYISSEDENGLLKAILLHSVATGGAIITDLLTEGHTGRFYMGISISF